MARRAVSERRVAPGGSSEKLGKATRRADLETVRSAPMAAGVADCPSGWELLFRLVGQANWTRLAHLSAQLLTSPHAASRADPQRHDERDRTGQEY